MWKMVVLCCFLVPGFNGERLSALRKGSQPTCRRAVSRRAIVSTTDRPAHHMALEGLKDALLKQASMNAPLTWMTILISRMGCSGLSASIHTRAVKRPSDILLFLKSKLTLHEFCKCSCGGCRYWTTWSWSMPEESAVILPGMLGLACEHTLMVLDGPGKGSEQIGMVIYMLQKAEGQFEWK